MTRIVFNRCWNLLSLVCTIEGSGIAQEIKWVNVQVVLVIGKEFNPSKRERRKSEKVVLVTGLESQVQSVLTGFRVEAESGRR